MTAKELFWDLAAELQEENSRVVEGTIMKSRCLRVGEEFLALVDYKGSGLVVNLPPERVAALIEQGIKTVLCAGEEGLQAMAVCAHPGSRNLGISAA